MAIDIRANVSCSLGPVISGSIGDDYIQGSGLIKTTGSVVINDLITPEVGTIVTFSYVKNGITRNIPRKLRVKSSFADPFRRTTQVELGCKLDYLSDLKDRLNWTALDDPENDDYTEDDTRIVLIPIHASSVMEKCLTELGISASSIPLTNKFSISEFSYDSGYVSILSDLLVSESYCGYLDINEVLQVFSLDGATGNTGPVITANDIIDLGPIGVGQLPGEAVTVSYSTLKLKPPTPQPVTEEEEEEYEQEISRINWESSTTNTSSEPYYINWRDENKILQTVSFNSSSSTTTRTTYTTISYYDSDGKVQVKEVPSSRSTTTTAGAISKMASIASAYYSKGTGNFNNAYITISSSDESFEYDSQGNETLSVTRISEPEASILSATQFDWVFEGQNFVASYDLRASQRKTVSKLYAADYEQSTTDEFVRWAFTQAGEQALAIFREESGVDTISEANVVAVAVLDGGLVHNKSSTTTDRSGRTTSQERPKAADRLAAEYSDGGDPNNGYRTESSSELELALGSPTAQRRIEFSMPYASDDSFSTTNGTVYLSTSGDAATKANLYGRVQNRLLLGNRSGISLQLAPEKLPSAPFEPIFVEANGLTAEYRVNAANWAFDSNGIVCSTDALFWAAVGGTGTFWFPVAPGITTLPSTPPVVDTSPAVVVGTVPTVGSTPQTVLNSAFPGAVLGDGVQDQNTTDFWVYNGSIWTDVGPNPGPTTTATTLIPPYNETAIYVSRIHLVPLVTKFDYSLELLTEVDSPIYAQADNYSMRPIRILTSVDLNIEAYAPVISNSIDVRVSNTPGVDIATEIPEIRNSIDVRIPADMSFIIAAHVPQVGANIGLVVAPPSVDIAISSHVPQVGYGIGKVISPPNVDITVTALAPLVGGLVRVPVTAISIEQLAPTIQTV